MFFALMLFFALAAFIAGAVASVKSRAENQRYGPSLVLLEHGPAPEAGEGMETLDLVRAGAG